jgi:hypothetical protein
MTEAEWLACEDPDVMLEFLGDRASTRKLRLYSAACFRYDWKAWTSRRERAAVLTAEWMADGAATDKDVDAVRAALVRRLDELDSRADLECTPHVPADILRPDFTWKDASGCVYQVAAKADSGPDSFDGCEAEVLVELAALARDIFGNPFRPVAFDPRWRTADAVGLARAIYEDRVFVRMPLLADALMDVGCDDGLLLAHCRTAGQHARGCFALDLVLGRR